jgi:pimeloyl-ACP methyl ester carboxylesterase/predicted Ser/Thr protein kinase
MEPQIRYCTSADGTRIAYTAAGEGPALLFVPSSCFNFELVWREPDFRPFLAALSREHLFALFDRRGVGCSQRDVKDLSLEAQVQDIDAVADHLQLEQFNLWGAVDGAAVTVAYAAKHPARVSRLVLWAPYPDGSEVISREALDSLLGLIRNNWSVARRTLANITFPSGPTKPQRWFSDLLRESLSPETAAKHIEFQNTVVVRSLLPEVKAPTLILHRRDARSVPIQAGRATAALIPDVRFVTLDGDILHPLFGDTSYVKTMLQFLEEDGGRTRTTDLLAPDDAAEESQTPGLEGKAVSHYRVMEKLGEGGMGVVYRAEDTTLERTVALKFLSSGSFGTEEEKRRFIREAKAAAALDHPNICTVHEIADAEGQTFIAMAYIDGESLEEKLEFGPLNVDEALDVAVQVAEGLQEAHEKGIVHRDIKAANIMVTRRGHARIMDFGLAKLAGKTRLTKTATIMGTVAYMSPEQAHGEATIDHRTDIWSLGVVLYEMLAGRLPFDAPTDAGLIHKIIYEHPKPLEALRSDIPGVVEQAVEKMMQKNPEDRYEDMGAVVSDLKSIRSGPSRR